MSEQCTALGAGQESMNLNSTLLAAHAIIATQLTHHRFGGSLNGQYFISNGELDALDLPFVIHSVDETSRYRDGILARES